MSELRIRHAGRDDLPRIVEIYNATIPSREVTADTEPVSVESRIAWFEAHRPGKRPLWVAESAGGIEGWLSISMFYGRPAYDGTAELSVYVAADRRGRGLGSMLMRHALAQAPALGIDALIGFIFRHNPRSLRLFHNHGFERWGLLPAVAVLDGAARDVVIVGRKLAA
ncbi:MAG TPA: GNAT family N-acetyltransferase [Burkholderiales bacterium]|nr:GNAT family N-acetyltransferase [Burkholderiales bacterium]